MPRGCESRRHQTSVTRRTTGCKPKHRPKRTSSAATPGAARATPGGRPLPQSWPPGARLGWTGLSKLLARIDGHAMIAHVAESALASFLWPVIVVGHFARGLGTSIRAGLACSSSPNCRHFPATMADVRFFLERHAGHVCEVAYPDDAVLADVDTREALGRLVSRS
jgi:hypothetical protein